MTNTIDFILTTAANEIIFKVLSGKTLNFTRMAVGDGFSYDTNAAKNYTALVNEVLSLDITKIETSSLSSVRVTSAFKNTDTEKEFYYREVGLYAQDPDTGKEILYAYGNRNDAAELITPTGSSVITKQLIFIISVGDSANVTFNVNEDVYALQEDMLNVQENKADKNLANTGMITNCLLEVPHKIKLNIVEGTLNLLAGSKVYIPNGFEADGITKKFDEIVIDNNVSYSDVYGDTRMMFLNTNSMTMDGYGLSLCFSGPIPPTESMYLFWYDTEKNLMKRSVDFGVTWLSGFSLPLCIQSNTVNKGITSIDQVFNGMGYIGSTVWVDKGVKGLIPNGISEDGTLANINSETHGIYIYTFDSTYNRKHIISLTTGSEYSISGMSYKYTGYVYCQNEKPAGVDKWWYHISENQWKYIHNDGEIANYFWLDVGECDLVNGIITSFKPYVPFKIINNLTGCEFENFVITPTITTNESYTGVYSTDIDISELVTRRLVTVYAQNGYVPAASECIVTGVSILDSVNRIIRVYFATPLSNKTVALNVFCLTE